MSKTVTVEELAADVETYIADVQKGDTLTITAEGKPVATITPTNALDRLIRHRPQPGLRFQDVPVGPRPPELKTDAAQIVIDERNYERNEKRWRS